MEAKNLKGRRKKFQRKVALEWIFHPQNFHVKRVLKTKFFYLFSDASLMWLDIPKRSKLIEPMKVTSREGSIKYKKIIFNDIIKME